MAQNKKSFLLYCDIIHTISKLENEKAGILFKHILEYVNDLNPITNDIIIELVFEPIKQSLKRDLEKYENIINRNRLNGYKGGRPKNTNNPKNPLGYLVTQENPNKPKKADSDIDSDSDSDSDNNKRNTPNGVKEKGKDKSETKESVSSAEPRTLEQRFFSLYQDGRKV